VSVAAIGTIVLILASTIWRDSRLLFQTSLPTGVDGYYYVLQIDALRHFRQLYFHTDTPFILYFLTGLSYITQSSVVAVKLGVLILNTILIVGMAVFARSVTGSNRAGLLAAAITGLSGLHLSLVAEFVNNLGAIAFLVWAAVLLLRFARTRNVIWLAISVVCLLLSADSHRLIIPLVLLNGCLLLVAYQLTHKSERAYNIPILAILLVVFILPLLIARQQWISLSPALAYEFLKWPRLPLRQVDLAERLMLAASLIFTSVIWSRQRQLLLNNVAGLVLVSVSLLNLLLTLNPFLNHDTGVTGMFGRLGILSYLQVAIVIPIAFSMVIRKFRGWMSVVIMAGTLGLLLWSFSMPIPPSLRPDYVHTRESMVLELPELRAKLCANPFIVARHGDEFLVTSRLGIPSQQSLPVQVYECIYWLLRKPQNLIITGPGTVNVPNGEFLLIEDDHTLETLRSLNRSEYDRLLAENPHLRKLLAGNTH
jgi:hypothetical protein